MKPIERPAEKAVAEENTESAAEEEADRPEVAAAPEHTEAPIDGPAARNAR